jgi:Tol biopolymer transport system component
MGSAVPIEKTALRTGELPVEFLWMDDSESHEPLDVKEPEAENLEMTTEGEKPAGLANYGLSETSSESTDDPEDVIVEPNSGLRFTKVFSGPKLDVIGRIYYMTVSRDGSYLYAPLGPGDMPPGWVIPLKEGQEPFKITPFCYLSWSWDTKNIAYIARPKGDLYVMPFSPETGQATGPAKMILEGTEEQNIMSKGLTPPRWSPDGQHIAFSWGKNGNFDIWTIPATGGNPKQITDDPADERDPFWLPDGKTIVFRRVRGTDQSGANTIWDEWIVPAAGGTAEKILEDAPSPFGISADGKWLALYRKRGEFGLARLDDKRQINVAIPEEAGDLIGWSGNKLIFCKPAMEEWSGLRVVHTYGGPSVELGEGINLDSWGQRWSPDGKFIVTGGGYDFTWIVPTTGGTPTKLELKTEPKMRISPYESLSPNLKHYAFLDEESSLWIAPVSIEQRKVTDPAVKIAEELARSLDQVNVSWSSDSAMIAFSSTKGGNADIWIASVDGSNLKQLTHDPGDEKDPVWSPDGSMLAYNKENSVWVVPAAGGEPREIARKESWSPTWSPDSKEIAFVQNDRQSISIIELSKGRIRRIENIPKGIWKLIWSPDGRKLAFLANADGRNHVWVLPVTGGEPVNLSRDDPGLETELYWSPDGRMLSFNSFKSVKVRTGSIWEADISELLGE